MKAKVAKWGNSIAVRLPRPLVEELGLVPGREVDIRRDGTRLTLETASRKVPHYRLEDLLAQIKPGTRRPRFEHWDITDTEWPADDWSDIAPSDKEWNAWKKAAEVKRSPERKRAVPSRRSG